MNGKDDRKFDDDLLERAAKLAAPVAPERDLWPGIEQAITVPRKPRRSAWNGAWAQAAAVILLVGGSSGLTYLTMSGARNAVVPTAAEAPVLVFEQASANFGSQYTLGPDFQDARSDLVEKFEQRIENLSPEARVEVLANIETIRKAIDDINRALSREPDNVLLQELLINTYRDELSMMIEVDGITGAAMRRGDI
jgi:hypothetical protein